MAKGSYKIRGNRMKLSDLKEMVTGDKKVRFSHYKQGNLYYKAENGFEFPIPISDTGEAEFSADLQDLATRLRTGSDVVYDKFHKQRLISEEFERAGRKHTMWFRTMVLRHTASDLFHSVAREISTRIKSYVKIYDKATTINTSDLLVEQSPFIAITGCSDSRIKLDTLLQTDVGQSFTFTNIGGSFEHSEDPYKLSEKARDFLFYASQHLHITDCVVTTHGKCGCIENALKCEDTDENSGFKTLAVQKKHLLSLTDSEEKISAILATLGRTSYIDKTERKLQAMEIVHGLHNKKLAEEYLKKITPAGKTPMRIILVHFDIRTLNVYMFNSDTNKFVCLNRRCKKPKRNTCKLSIRCSCHSTVR